MENGLILSAGDPVRRCERGESVGHGHDVAGDSTEPDRLCSFGEFRDLPR